MLAVELFETTDGRLLVNELAMRPHNTGHWTIDGAVTSQFEQHLRAVLDLPLGDPSPLAPWSVMVNVLGGPAGETMPDRYPSALAGEPGVKFHSYGKESRPGRKVGHVTAIGDDLDDVRRAGACRGGVLPELSRTMASVPAQRPKQASDGDPRPSSRSSWAPTPTGA